MANPEVVVKRERDEIPESAIGVTYDIEKKAKLENDVVGTEAVVRLGTQEFASSRQMFETLQGWLMPCWTSVQPLDCEPMLLDLVKKGHPEPDKMIGCGVDSFQARLDGMCSDFLTFFVVRKDGSTADFCFRSCVNNILPLPHDLKDQGCGVVAVCACLVGGGMMFLETARRMEANSVVLGSMKFNSSYHTYSVFFQLLIRSPLNEALGEENAMLLDLLKQGDPEWEKKIGSSGVESFQVGIHPGYGGILRSFYFVRGDGSMEDFCFIKCIEHIIPSTNLVIERYASPCSCHHEEDGEGVVTLGWKQFRSSAEMVSYFESSDRTFPLDNHTDPITITKQIEQTAMLSLLKKGDPERWEKKKMGSGADIQSIERRRHPYIGVLHPLFGVVRKDGRHMEYFCYKKCIDKLFPPPMGHQRLCSAYGDCTVNSRLRRSNGGRGRGQRNNLELQVQNQQEQIEILNKLNDARQEYIQDLKKYIQKNGLPPPPSPASPLLNVTQMEKENGVPRDVKEEKMY